MINFILKVCLFAAVLDVALLFIFATVGNFLQVAPSSFLYKFANKFCDFLCITFGVVAFVAMITGIVALFQKLFL